jgi:hypothetical protein
MAPTTVLQQRVIELVCEKKQMGWKALKWNKSLCIPFLLRICPYQVFFTL